MKKIDISKSFKLAMDIILCFLILLQSLKKGGFYSSDIYFFVGSVAILGVVFGLYYSINYIINIAKKNKQKIKILDIKPTFMLLGVLALAYLLPILFNTAANIQDAKFEFFRYVSIFIVYLIIRNSNNKKIYYCTLIAIGLIQAFVGIDGLASRLLQPYLKLLNSGYLSKDLTRLSGTIQYANTAAILIGISGILLLDKLYFYISKIKEKNNKINNLMIWTYFSLFTISTMTVILTGSRSALTIYVITSFIYLIKTKTDRFNISFIVITSYIISFLGSNNILDLVLTAPNKIYFVFLTYVALSIITIRYVLKYIVFNSSIENRISKIKLNKVKIVIVSLALFGIYVLVGLNIYKPLELVNNTKENVISRQIYGLKENDINDIKINIKENESGSKYSIVVYEEDEEFVRTELTRFEYYSNENDKFELSFRPKKNTKRLDVDLICYEGTISITEFRLNNEIKPLEYSILPSEMVFRFRDSIYGSTSLRDRLHYIKDSFKIWLTSPFFGTGGEGFKHLYKEVQTLEYTSSEAHNSILQVFVESGIIGGLTLCLIIYLVIKENKYSALKLAFIMYILHSFTDLNFSYLICLITFSMMIGIIESRKENVID